MSATEQRLVKKKLHKNIAKLFLYVSRSFNHNYYQCLNTSKKTAVAENTDHKLTSNFHHLSTIKSCTLIQSSVFDSLLAYNLADRPAVACFNYQM